MTKEEAKDYIREWCPYDRQEEIIKALEQEPCEDAVSRREAIKKFTYSWKGERIPDYDCDNFPTQIDIKTVKEILKGLPPVTPQSKTVLYSGDGYVDGYMVYDMAECPNCGQALNWESEGEE